MGINEKYHLTFHRITGQHTNFEPKNQLKVSILQKGGQNVKNNLLISGHAYLFCPIISSSNCSWFSTVNVYNQTKDPPL